MGYHPRIETIEFSNLATTRTRGSLLWLINNKPLENAILGYAAKYAERYQVSLYALAIEGNHLHLVAHFPKRNRAAFMRDLNASVARAVARHVPNFQRGNLWGRRYSVEFLPDPGDVKKYFFYTVLQIVKDGLVQRIADYPGYNCFHDAAHGIARHFKVVNWTKYNAEKRRNRQVSIQHFEEIVTLRYTRLPGYESVPQQDYVKLLHEELESRRQQLVKERLAEGKGFLGRAALLALKPGAEPHNTKTSDRYSHRPRVLCQTPERRAEVLSWYFGTLNSYREASRRYRGGDLTAPFPDGMYKPPICCIPA